MFKLALYLSTATIGPATATYTATGEVTATGYTAGGATVTNVAPTGGTWPVSVAVSYPITASTGNFDCALLYNTSKSNKTVAAYTFTAQNVSGTFTLTMPASLLTIA